MFVNKDMRIGGIRSSLLSLIKLYKEEYDINIICLSLEMQDEDYEYFDENNINIISPGLLINAFYTSGSYLRKSRHWITLLVKVILKMMALIVGHKEVVQFILSRRRNHLDRMYDVVISYSNDIWCGNVCIPGCNYYVGKNFPQTSKIGWIHAELDYLGLNESRLLNTYAQFSNVVCVSRACKEEVLRVCQKLSNKIDVIHNNIDISLIEETKKIVGREIKKTDEFNIVTVCRIEMHSKRLDRVVEIAKKLRLDNIKFKWLIVGDGLDYFELKSLLEKNGVDEHVQLLGEQKNPYPYMIRADVFVLVSDTESFGIVLKESIACGTPVITTDFGAAKEVVKEGVTGYIVKKNSDDIYIKLKELYFDQNLRALLQRNCSKETINSYDEFRNLIQKTCSKN